MNFKLFKQRRLNYYPHSPALQPYRVNSNFLRETCFWFGYLRETFSKRRLSRLVNLRLDKLLSSEVQSLEKLPGEGSFMLIVNHYLAGATLDVLAAVIEAASRARPDLADQFVVVIGRRKAQRPTWLSRLIRANFDKAFERWNKNLLQIAWRNERPSIQALREWRECVKSRPTLVFPEGKTSLEFGEIRIGSGRWLSSLGIPIVPVGVWWYNERWYVNFGTPIKWATQPELYDVQLGLNIANLLPEQLCANWIKGLAEWKEVHQQPALKD